MGGVFWFAGSTVQSGQDGMRAFGRVLQNRLALTLRILSSGSGTYWSLVGWLQPLTRLLWRAEPPWASPNSANGKRSARGAEKGTTRIPCALKLRSLAGASPVVVIAREPRSRFPLLPGGNKPVVRTIKGILQRRHVSPARGARGRRTFQST